MPGRARATSATTITAPVMGLNDRDAIANMKPEYAVIMRNWWPEPSEVSIRKGSITHATGLPAAVETIFEYNPPSGATKVFAAADGDVYDVTASGTVGAAVITGKSNDRWQAVPMTTPGGNFVYIFNGVDEPMLYNGTTWMAVDDVSTPNITGLTTSDIVDGVVFKGRLYLVEVGSMSLWYLPPAQVGGSASDIDMGQIFQRGGRIVTARTWTIDAGDGSDDHLVVISSEGEVAVFAGFDPSDANTWRLVGLFYLGKPIGQRCAVKFGGDLLIITRDGVFPLGSGLLSASIDKRVALTDAIQNKIRLDATTNFSRFGWQLVVFSQESALILNTPGQFASKQYVMNTLTGAWSEFNGWDANCWLYSQDSLFYGTDDGRVVRAWVQNSDDGTPITADVLPAFSYFGSKAANKFFTLVRPYLATGGKPSILYSLNGDFQASDPFGVLVTTPPEGMTWGAMVWGSMIWGGSLQQVQDWLTVGGVYKSASLRLQVNNNQAAVTWAATDYVYTRGGIL